MVGGLLVSQLVTLYLTPVFYTYMAALQTKLGRKSKGPARLAPPAGSGRHWRLAARFDRERSVPMQAQFLNGRGLHFLKPQFRPLSLR